MKLEQSFDVAAPLERVWEALIDVEHVAPCLPGAAVTGRNDDGTYNGTFTIKIGPDDRLLHRQARDGERRRGDAHARRCRRTGPTSAARAAPRRRSSRRCRRPGSGDAGRGRDRLPHHRPAGAVRARRDDRGHLRAAAAGVRARGCSRRCRVTRDGRGEPERREAAGRRPRRLRRQPTEAPEEDRWQTVNVAALTRDGAQASEEPAPVADEPTEAAAAPETSEAPTEANEEPPPVVEAPAQPPRGAAPARGAAPPEAPPPPEAPLASSARRHLQARPPQPVEPFDAGSAVGSRHVASGCGATPSCRSRSSRAWCSR